MEGRLLDLDDLAAGGRELAQLVVHRLGHVPDQLLLVVEVVLGGMAVQEEGQHLSRAGAELHRPAGAGAACCAMRQIFAYSSGFFGSCSTLPTTRGQRQVL